MPARKGHFKPEQETVNSVQTLCFVLGMTLFATVSQGASFDCRKATTLIESAICSDSELSALDEALLESYKAALLNASDNNVIKQEQRSWLKNVRNSCRTADCLKQAYRQRIAELDILRAGSQENAAGNIVMGRCHMDSCWWWQIDSTETVQKQGSERLVKVAVRTTQAEYASDYVDRHGYPNYPEEYARWGDVSTSYLLCSKTTPTYLYFDDDENKYIGAIPFDNDGTPWGVTEGVANLYDHVCNGVITLTYSISQRVADMDIKVAHPTDLFSYFHP